jgi:hypothetical protein
MSIESRFRAYLPKERIKGLWETDAGLAFIQRQRIESGLWESPDRSRRDSITWSFIWRPAN